MKGISCAALFFKTHICLDLNSERLTVQQSLPSPEIEISWISSGMGHGLLRRPIRYNTLLIRNTRIIRKRIFAILGVPWASHQPPPNHHELSPQPPEFYNSSCKDPEWHRVIVMGWKGQIYEMPDARCQMPEFRDSAAVPPASASTS